MQMLPSTAREQAAKLGLPYRPDMLAGSSPDAANYQTALGRSYLAEGLNKTGNLYDAFRYYYGGPNRRMWGRKTNAYANQVMGRM